jgi:hypothetical protein
MSDHDSYSDCVFGFAFTQRGAVHEKQMPFMAGKAPVRPRRQARGVGVHRSEAQRLDGRSGRIRRRFSQEGQGIGSGKGKALRDSVRFGIIAFCTA